MKELTVDQVVKVSGGFRPPTQIWPGMSARLALTTFAGLGAVKGAFLFGFGIGCLLNEYTDIQKYIANALE